MIVAGHFILPEWKKYEVNVEVMAKNSINHKIVKIWKLKACPRCGGDIFLDKIVNTWSVQCLQCSYQRELGNMSEVELQTEYEKESALTNKRRFPPK